MTQAAPRTRKIPMSKPIQRHGLALLAALAAAGAQAQAPANPYSYSRTSSYTYYQPADGAKAGLLKSETVEPGNAPSCVSTTYDYDGYGNRKQTTVANCAGAAGRALFDSRSGSTTYAGTTQAITVAGTTTTVQVPEGQFADSDTNAQGHTETRQVDPRFGTVTQLTGPNQLSTRWEVDDFGRTVREARADGTSTLTWTCLVAAGLDSGSNTVIDGVGCPTPSAAEIPADALLFRHSEDRDTQGRRMGSFTRVYSDRLGREIRSVTEGFDGAGQPAGRSGALVVRDTRYSAQGLKVLQTQPYYLASGASTLTGSNDQGVTRTDYDALGRAVAVYAAEPNGSQAGSQAVDFGPWGVRRAARRTFAYAALATTETDDAGHSRTTEKNALGEVVRLTDPTGAQLVHQHDAFGNLVASKDALQNRITLVYDIRGRKLRLDDPDAGTTAYCHDALGQLKAQQNANLRGSGSSACPDIADSGPTATAVPGWATLAYDRLGRLTQRAEPELTSTWSYDRYADGTACAKGTGKLCESRTGNGVNRKRVYDALGRLASQRTDMANGPSLATAVGYDSTTGRQASQTYPTGVQVAYGYTALGYLDKLSLVTAATVNPLPATPGGAPGASASLPAGTVLWQAQAANAWGKAEQQGFGNGVIGRAAYEAATGRTSDLTAGPGSATTVLSQHYTWSSLGNLMTRGDSNGDGSTGAVSEQFGYDALDRLASYTVAAPAIPSLARSVTLQYNALGMLLHKSDVGNYAYGAQGPGATRPHAVQSVTGAGSTSYGYDANGNLTSASAGKYRSIAYTSFNLPDSQTGAQGPAGTPRYQWLYDEDHARVKETRTDANGTRVTWFLHPDNAGGLGFESETVGSAVSNRHYLSAGSIAVGVLVSTGALPDLGSAQTVPTPLANVTLAKVEYWHKDHLGSLAATTDHTGAVTARYAYDPFGKRRFTQGTYDAAGTLVIDWSNAVNNGTDRGFTGHEHLDDVGLIHMNGRIYDPTLGRFLSADPHVAAAFDLQNYDRYAYVLNNPLASTDPTGFDSNREPWLNDHGFDGALPRVVIPGSPFDAGGSCAGGNAMCMEHIMQTLGNRPVTTALFMGFTAQMMPAHPAAKAAFIAAIAAVVCNANEQCKAKVGQAAAQLSRSFEGMLSDNAKQEDKAADGLKTDGATAPETAASGADSGGWEVPQEAKDKIPAEWGEGEPNRKGEGQRWQDPNDKGSGVRIDKGNPDNSQPSQQVDHVVVRDKGRVIGSDGQPINGSIKENPSQSHIPLRDWIKWSNWNKP